MVVWGLQSDYGGPRERFCGDYFEILVSSELRRRAARRERQAYDLHLNDIIYRL